MGVHVYSHSYALSDIVLCQTSQLQSAFFCEKKSNTETRDVPPVSQFSFLEFKRGIAASWISAQLLFPFLTILQTSCRAQRS